LYENLKKKSYFEIFYQKFAFQFIWPFLFFEDFDSLIALKFLLTLRDKYLLANLRDNLWLNLNPN